MTLDDLTSKKAMLSASFGTTVLKTVRGFVSWLILSFFLFNLLYKK